MDDSEIIGMAEMPSTRYSDRGTHMSRRTAGLASFLVTVFAAAALAAPSVASGAQGPDPTKPGPESRFDRVPTRHVNGDGLRDVLVMYESTSESPFGNQNGSIRVFLNRGLVRAADAKK